MNNVCLASQVAVLFRRLVHVVSTVSVAQQYLFYQRNRPAVEHTSSPPAIECQDLSLAQALLNAERSPSIPRVLAEQWGRLKGVGFWESWRSSLASVQQSQQQLSFSAYLLHTRPLAFTYSTTVTLGLLPWFKPTRPHSTQSPAPTPQDRISHASPNANPEPQPSGPEPDPHPPVPRWSKGSREDTIRKLMLNPTLFDPIRTPRYPIVLCHGGYSTPLRMVARVNWKTSRTVWV
jgi:hypothetical protein